MTFENVSNKKLKSFEKLINIVLHNGYLVYLYDYKEKQIIGILTLDKDANERILRKADGYKVNKIGTSKSNRDFWLYMEKE